MINGVSINALRTAVLVLSLATILGACSKAPEHSVTTTETDLISNGPTGPATEWLFVSPELLNYLKTPPPERIFDNKLDLATMYLYGVTVSRDPKAARKLFDEAEAYWLKNKDADNSGNVNWGRFNDLKKQRLALIETAMFASDPVLVADYQELVGEKTKFDESCDRDTRIHMEPEKSKQRYFACVLEIAIRTGSLNSMVVEALKKQGADFSDKAFEQKHLDFNGPSTSGPNVDPATSGWMRLVDYGLNPNLLIDEDAYDQKHPLISRSINCGKTFADFRLAVLLLQKGAAPDGDTYTVLGDVAQNCPEHDGANKFIELAVSKGAKVDREVSDVRGNRVKLVDLMLANGKPNMAAILTKAGAQVDQASLDKETQRLTALQKRAAGGDHTAQLELGLYYLEKSGELAAEPYLRKAANGGIADAQYEMAFLNHIPRERRYWLEKAADQGHPTAVKMLGRPTSTQRGDISSQCATYFARLDMSSAPVHLRQMQADAAGCGNYEPN